MKNRVCNFTSNEYMKIQENISVNGALSKPLPDLSLKFILTKFIQKLSNFIVISVAFFAIEKVDWPLM